MSITRLTTNGLTGTKYDTVSADNYYMEPIATTLLASATGTITFSNIPQNYKHLQIRWMCLNSSQQTDIRLNFNSDTGTNYSYHQIYSSGSAAGASAGTSATFIIGGVGGFTSNPAAGIADILDYSNVYKYKTYRGLSGIDENGSGYIMLKSGLWQNTGAITSIVITPAAGNFNTNSRFSLFGVKA